MKDVGEIVSGGTPSTKEPSYWDGDIAWISPADLSGYAEKYIVRGRKSISEAGLKNSSARLMKKGAVLFSSRAPIGYVAIGANEVCTNQGFKSIVPNESVTSDYLYYYLKASKAKAEDAASGTTFKEISLKNFSALPIPLPPLAEQERIVAKIEALFSELDAGKQEAEKALQQLKTYRQAVLKWAFEGRLTNEHVVDGELPEGWRRVKFGEIHKIKSNLVDPKDFGDFPHIAPDNITKGTGQLLEYRTIKEDGVFSPKHRFFKGQIVYSKIRPNLAKVIIASFDGLCSADMYPIESSLDNRFTYYYMLSKAFVDKASNTESRTVLPKINQKGLNEIDFPLCSLQEQHRIVQEIEARLSVCDEIERTIAQSLQQAEALRQSILKKAFEGKLL